MTIQATEGPSASPGKCQIATLDVKGRAGRADDQPWGEVLRWSGLPRIKPIDMHVRLRVVPSPIGARANSV